MGNGGFSIGTSQIGEHFVWGKAVVWYHFWCLNLARTLRCHHRDLTPQMIRMISPLLIWLASNIEITLHHHLIYALHHILLCVYIHIYFDVYTYIMMFIHILLCVYIYIFVVCCILDIWYIWYRWVQPFFADDFDVVFAPWVRIPALDKRTQDGGTEVPRCDAVIGGFFYITAGGFIINHNYQYHYTRINHTH